MKSSSNPYGIFTKPLLRGRVQRWVVGISGEGFYKDFDTREEADAAAAEAINYLDTALAVPPTTPLRESDIRRILNVHATARKILRLHK